MHEYSTPEFMAKVLAAYDIDFTDSKVICPFHGDINASMSIDLAKSRVYCFGCGRAYNATEFIEAAEPKLDKLHVYSRLAQIAKGVKINLDPKYIRDNSVEDFEQLRLQAADYYYNLPKTDWENGEWTDELDYLVERGLSQKVLNQCGAKINYNSYYPIIFPIIDNGKFMGWVCRTTNKDLEKKRKYLYNTGFRRRMALCGRYQKGKPVVLVEGYMDMLKLRQQGVKNVAALLGWKASVEQIDKLKKAKITTVISALDNDESGIKGDTYLRTLGFKKVWRWKFKKEQKDPGDQTPKDIKQVIQWLRKSIDI